MLFHSKLFHENSRQCLSFIIVELKNQSSISDLYGRATPTFCQTRIRVNNSRQNQPILLDDANIVWTQAGGITGRPMLGRTGRTR
jgi:hypothetical protein